MKYIPLAAGLAGLLALTSVAAAVQAQPAAPDPAGQQQDYQRQQDRYHDAQADYQNRTDDYIAGQLAYQRERAHFRHERAEYDTRHGEGSFERYYREHHSEYDSTYGRGSYDRDFAEQRDADHDDGPRN